MKRILPIFILIFFTASCSGSNGKREAIATDGSSSMERVIGFLGEYYMDKNPDVKVSFNPTGSSAGIQAVIDGRCDIALSSRELKENELEKGLVGTVAAIDAIAVIVNKSNFVSGLSLDEISGIYTGRIIKWSELGGEDIPIVRIGREAASGTRDGFESITDTKGKCKYTQELTSSGDIIQTVSSNPNAIGYASLSSVKDNVKLIAVDGVIPDNETVRDGSYKIRRDFLFVTKSDAYLSDAANKFLKFATSKEADGLILRAGAVPPER